MLEFERQLQENVGDLSRWTGCTEAAEKHRRLPTSNPWRIHPRKRAEFFRVLSEFLGNQGPSDFVLRNLREHRQLLAQIQMQLDELREKVGIGQKPPPDDFEAWLTSDDAKQYAGQEIAFLRGSGVVASSFDGNELVDKVENHPQLHEMIFAIVPDGSL